MAIKSKNLHYKSCGLDYVFVKVPISIDEDGEEYIDLPMQEVEMAIAYALIKLRVPLRGIEVKFLRKTLGLTLKDWSAKFGLTAAGSLKWETATATRLSRVNEVAVRAFCAEELGVEISGTLSSLVGKDKTPKRISVKLDLDAA